MKRGPRSAETIILLPNLGWDSHAWAQNFSILSRQYHVIAIDPLGFGRSAKPLLDYKMDTWTDMLAEFLRVQGIPRATFAGAVMGGALSVQMALDHPDRVEGIIVAASNSGPGPHEGGMSRIPSEPSLAGTRANLLALFYDSSLVSDALVRERFAFRLRANDGYTIQRHLADHRAPYTPEELSRIPGAGPRRMVSAGPGYATLLGRALRRGAAARQTCDARGLRSRPKPRAAGRV